MRNIIAIVVLFMIGAAAFWVAGVLSPDAVPLAVGMLFGVLAGAPVFALLQAQRQPLSPAARERLDRQYAELWGDGNPLHPITDEEVNDMPQPVAVEPHKSRWELLELRPKRHGMPPLPPIKHRWVWK